MWAGLARIAIVGIMTVMAREYGDFLAPEFIAMAHRGGALYAPNLGIENTLRAFGNAVDLGYTYLETDVHATKDGQLVSFHDAELHRVTGYGGAIEDLTLAQVQELHVGGREAIPTIDELFETFPKARFNLDLKANGAVLPLAEKIRSHHAERRVCVCSFSLRRLRRFRRLVKGTLTAISPLGVAAMSVGLARLPGRAEVVFQVPLTHRIAGVTKRIITPERIRAIHRAGRKINAWTVDDPEVMHELIDWGIDGIVTDRPDLLKGVLRARGMWSTQ